MLPPLTVAQVLAVRKKKKISIEKCHFIIYFKAELFRSFFILVIGLRIERHQTF